MKSIRRLTAAVTVLALALTLFCGAIPVSAASIQLDGTYVNPLYEDTYVIKQHQRTSSIQPFSSSESNYLTSDAAVAAEVRDGMKNRSAEIVIYFESNQKIDTTELLREYFTNILSIALEHTGKPTEGDYLRWQYGSVSYGLSGSVVNSKYRYQLSLNFDYYTTAAQENSLTREISNLLTSLNVSSASDYAKLKAIYDYICANVTYDYTNLDNNSYDLKYTAYAALMNGTAVCQGYALLFYRLALELGVDSRLIAGDGGGPHGWNIAELNNLYYNLDSTWDAGSTEYSYFLVCPNNFRDHIRYDEYDTAAFHRDYPMDDVDFDPSSLVCNHSYTSTVTKEPTCTASGTITYTCSKCGDSYSETASALGHQAVTDSAVDPTCTTEGKTQGSHCSRCNEILTAQTAIPATGHSWKDASCTAPKTCQVCGTTEGSVLEHNWDNGIVTKEPTETATGIRTFTCTRCSATKTETIPTISHTHQYTSVVTAPTCTEKGYTTHTCSCGDSYVTDEVDPLGHSWDGGVVTKEPTETATGIRTFTCTRCSATKTETIPAISHTHQYTSVVTAPTCTEKGYTTYTCSCGASYITDEVDALGHTWGNGVVTQEPTAQAPGIRTYTCTRCSATRTEEIPYQAPIEDVTRIAGNDRSKTAVAVADELKAQLGFEKFDTIIITNGDNFADALTGSYLAAARSAPILLYRASSIATNEQYIRDHLSTYGTVFILGGTSAVPEEVETGIRNLGVSVKRLSGATRFDTNLAILEAAGITNQEILICTGWEYADSLSASATGLPILMVNTKSGELTQDQIDFLTKYADNDFTIIGGPAAVSAEMEAKIQAIVGSTNRLYGATREATSVAVAECYFSAPESVLLAYSRDFPDGLCGGPLAYAMGVPLLLTNTNQESAAAEYVAENFIEEGYILGGANAIPDSSVSIIFGKN